NEIINNRNDSLEKAKKQAEEEIEKEKEAERERQRQKEEEAKQKKVNQKKIHLVTTVPIMETVKVMKLVEPLQVLKEAAMRCSQCQLQDQLHPDLVQESLLVV